MKNFGALLLALATVFTLGLNQHAIAKSTKSSASASSETIQVAGYTKKDGTVVKPYTRKKSSKSAEATKETKEVTKTETAPAASKTEVTKTDTKDSTKVKGKKSK